MHGPRDASNSTPPPSAPRDFAAMLAGNVVLALGPWLVRLSDVGPVAAGFWRLALALPVLVGVAAWSRRGGGHGALPPATWGLLALAGLFFAADLGSWHVGIHHTRLANATLFGNVTSFILPVYGYVVARAWPGRNARGALLLAFAGVVLLLGRSYELSPANFSGDLLCITAGLFYAGYLIVIGRTKALGPFTVLAASTAAGVLPLLGVAALLGEAIRPHDWTPLIALAAGSQLIGQGLVVYALPRLAPVVAGLTLLVQPLVAAAIGWIAYGERLGALDFVGAGAIAAALVLVRRPDRAISRALPTS